MVWQEGNTSDVLWDRWLTVDVQNYVSLSNGHLKFLNGSVWTKSGPLSCLVLDQLQTLGFKLHRNIQENSAHLASGMSLDSLLAVRAYQEMKFRTLSAFEIRRTCHFAERSSYFWGLPVLCGPQCLLYHFDKIDTLERVDSFTCDPSQVWTHTTWLG